MKCMNCGAEMKTKQEDYTYEESGLPVVLKDVEVSRCPECGELEVSIPNVEGLHRAIAQYVIQKRERLAAAEIRYLRKCLGASAVEFASCMGVAPETVSRWETGAQSMGGVAERLLRLMVASKEPVKARACEWLAYVAQEDPVPQTLGLTVGDNHRWRVEPCYA